MPMRIPAVHLTLALTLGTLAAGCGNKPAPPDARATAETPLPPPTRPTDVVLEAHFARPHETITQIGSFAGVHLPLALGLSLGLGIDSAVISSIDTQRPMDVVFAGRDRPEMVLVFTPAAGDFRSTLGGRFRLTSVAGLGDRLDPRQTSARPIEGMRCAVVGVPDAAMAARIVCANSAEALDHAGRYAAFYAAGHVQDTTDALVEIDGRTARAVVLPAAQRALEDLTRSMAASAAEERRAHNRPPDYGDPEAIVAMVTTLSRVLPAQAEDVEKLTLRAHVEPESVTLDTELALDPAGHSALARDAVARATGPTTQPLATRLPPDSFAALAARSPTPDRAALIADALDATIHVLGERVTDPATARADLVELFSHVGDALAAGAAHEPNNEGTETTVLFSLDDGGASARTALARIAHARWLTALRLGGGPVRPAMHGQTLLLQLPAAPPPTTPAPAANANGPGNHAANAETPATPSRPPTVAISVLGDVLVILVGHHVETSLAALGPRANGPAPGVLARVGDATAVGALDVAALRGMPDEHAPVTGTYGATREGDHVVGRGHLVIAASAIGALRRGLPGRPGGVLPRRRAVDE